LSPTTDKLVTDLKIEKHRDRTETERLAKSVRRELREQEKQYKKALNLNRPKLNKSKELADYDVHARNMGKKIAKLALRYMAVQTAFNYAETMISQDVGADGVNFDTTDGLNLSRKLLRCEIMKLLLHHFDVPAKEQQLILSLITNKEFSSTAKSLAPPPVTSQPVAPERQTSTIGVNKRMDRLGDRLEDVLKSISSIAPEAP
jgi:hypothetical protein